MKAQGNRVRRSKLDLLPRPSGGGLAGARRRAMIELADRITLPLLRRVQNAFDNGDASFDDREELGLDFVPEFVNVLRDRALSSTIDLIKRIDEDDK